MHVSFTLHVFYLYRAMKWHVIDNVDYTYICYAIMLLYVYNVNAYVCELYGVFKLWTYFVLMINNNNKLFN